MSQLQHVPCPHCQALNLPQDAICLQCGKPTRVVMDRTVLLPTPRQGLNSRQREFLRRYVLPVAIFVPIYLLLIALLKFPSLSVGEWLTQPIVQRPATVLYRRPPMPWWLLLAFIDSAITRGIIYVTKPLSWQD